MSLSGEATSPSSASSLAGSGVASEAAGVVLVVPYIQIDPPFGILTIVVPSPGGGPATTVSFPPEVLPADVAAAVAAIRDFARDELGRHTG